MLAHLQGHSLFRVQPQSSRLNKMDRFLYRQHSDTEMQFILCSKSAGSTDDLLSHGEQTEEIDTLVYGVFPAISEGNLSRLALTIGDQVFALRDSDHLSDFRESALQWDAPDLNWMDGDVLQVKLIELPVTATFDAAAYGSDEGGSVEVTVTLGDYFEKTVSLPLTVTGVGGATSADYSGVPSELVFAPGETEKTFTVELTDDEVDDDDESVTLSFGTLPSAVKTGGDHETATVAIRDDDDPEVDVEFGAATYSADEGGTSDGDGHPERRPGAHGQPSPSPRRGRAGSPPPTTPGFPQA